MRVNIPNVLTYIRIAMIPLVIGVFYLPEAWLSPQAKNQWACWMFTGAAITDWFDGYLARKLNQSSPFGAFLDPVADKLMVAAALCVLLQLDRVDAVLAFVIIGREIAISALREWMAQIGASKNVAVNMLGKVKTVSQLVAIPMLLFHDNFLGLFNAQQVGTILITVAAVLTVLSMITYLKAAWPVIQAKG
jgi:cardiolipin synthase (CMP-forming)